MSKIDHRTKKWVPTYSNLSTGEACEGRLPLKTPKLGPGEATSFRSTAGFSPGVHRASHVGTRFLTHSHVFGRA